MSSLSNFNYCRNVTEIRVMTTLHALIESLMLGYLGKGHMSAMLVAVLYLNVFSFSFLFRDGLMNLIGKYDSRYDMPLIKEHVVIRYRIYIGIICHIILSIIVTMLLLLSPITIISFSNTNNHTNSKAIQYILLYIPIFWITGIVFAMHNYTCYLLESNHNYNIHSTYITYYSGWHMVHKVSVLLVHIISSYIFIFGFGLGYAGNLLSTLLILISMAVGHIGFYANFNSSSSSSSIPISYDRRHDQMIIREFLELLYILYSIITGNTSSISSYKSSEYDIDSKIVSSPLTSTLEEANDDEDEDDSGDSLRCDALFSNLSLYKWIACNEDLADVLAHIVLFVSASVKMEAIANLEILYAQITMWLVTELKNIVICSHGVYVLIINLLKSILILPLKDELYTAISERNKIFLNVMTRKVQLNRKRVEAGITMSGYVDEDDDDDHTMNSANNHSDGDSYACIDIFQMLPAHVIVKEHDKYMRDFLIELYRNFMFKSVIYSVGMMMVTAMTVFVISISIIVDEDIQFRLTSIMLIASFVAGMEAINCCLFTVLDVFQYFFDGFLPTVIGRWMLGLTIAYMAGYQVRPRFGFAGIWYGIAIGNLFTAILLIIQHSYLEWNVVSRKLYREFILKEKKRK